jgi:hypothetical protein
MAEMRVDGVVAAPAFEATRKAQAAGGTSGGAGVDPMTAACSAAFDAASTAMVAADGIAADNEATAGLAGTQNVQNLERAEGNHAAQLRYPLTGPAAARQ